ncbi:MAG: M1 family aminopeptidase, partial [Acidimicrobiia bacterium]
WWDDLWLNESFATFMASLAQQKATRFKNAWVTFATSLKAAARRQDQLPSTHPIAADIPDIATCRVSFDDITYSKGASVLRQLVAWAGEDLFLEGIRNYFRKHEYGNTELTDFLSSIEETCGRDLHAWSKEWLETAGVNTLRPQLEVEADSIKKLSIKQEAHSNLPTLRRHRVAVGLYDSDTDGALVRRRRIELDVRDELTEVSDAAGEKLPELVLVNDDDLTYSKIRLDDRSLQTATEKLRSVKDPLAGALLWAAVWDMCRDAELSAREFLKIVLDNIDGEKDIGVIQRLIGQAEEVIVTYGDPANYLRGMQVLAEAAMQKLRAAAPGSDLQMTWAKSLIFAART